MQIRLDTKLEIVDDRRTKASIRLDVGGGGFTISTIFLSKNNDGKEDKWKITLPLMQINDRKKPVISLQGAMKAAIAAALNEDHKRLRVSGEKKLVRSRFYQNDFEHLILQGQDKACSSGSNNVEGGLA